MVEVLQDAALARNALPTALQGAMTALDNKNRRYFEGGKFIWDSRLEPAYPPAKFWFLYGKPPKKLPQR